VDDSNLAAPAQDAGVPAGPALPALTLAPPLPRWFAIVQAIAVSGIPSQLLVAGVLILTTNMTPWEGNGLSLEFLATVMLLDTALIALLIRVFLELSGETSRGVFLGRRPLLGETLKGLLMVPVVFGAVTAIVLTLRFVAPWLHTVQVNPLEQYMGNALDASIFLIVVVLGGGVKEELQRAFILHRFKQCLGGYRVGLVIFSIVFGLLHWDQGPDVAIAVGALGLFWGVLYIRRRSAVMGMTNHAGFNALQVAQGVLAKSFGL
jgi:membrane protease YdiL (CAAX protease family)